MNYFEIILLAGVLITASIIDIRVRKIPNWLTFSTVTAAMTHHLLASGIKGLILSLSGLALGMSVFIIIYLLGGMGAGDVKLMGAVGAMLGPEGAVYALFCTVLVGGIYAAVIFALNRQYLKDVLSQWSTSLKLYIRTGHIFRPLATDGRLNGPVLHYGLAIAIGTFLSIALAASNCQLLRI